MEPTVQVAIIGIFTTLITASGVVIAAIVNNKRERTGAAAGGVESTLRERLLLKDERLVDLQEDKARLQARLDEALEANDENVQLTEMLRSEMAVKEQQIETLRAEIIKRDREIERLTKQAAEKDDTEDYA